MTPPPWPARTRAWPRARRLTPVRTPPTSVFSGERLEAVVEAIDVSRSARRRALENFSFAALYNLVAAPAAMLGLVNPFVAALAMSGSSLVVTLNALRTGAGRR